MGIFESIRRIIMGEPVFKTQDQNGQPQSTQAQPPMSGEVEQRQGPKVLPQVMIERWICTPHGAGLHFEIYIRNYSQTGVVLKRIELFGLKDEIGGRHLTPGEHYEYVCDIQQRPNNTNLDECRLYFEADNGDYFMALHQIEFDKMPDGTFTLKRFKLLPPIRDV